MNREWLRAVRKEQGLTQCALAEKVGISQVALCNIESGKRRPSVDAAQKIAAALGFDWTRFYANGDGDRDGNDGTPTISPEHAAFAATLGFPSARRLVV